MSFSNTDFGKQLREVQRAVYETSSRNGFHDKPREFGTSCALIHSEISEALEAWRKTGSETEIWYEGTKPEGVPFEMADALIRILDWAEGNNVDLAFYVETKAEYNKTRGYMHGGKHV